MAPRIIYDSRTNANTPGAGWLMTQDPTDNGRDDLVRFQRHNGRQCLLDQIAEWTPTGWSPNRWVPRSPKVPRFLVSRVVNHMRRQELRSEKTPGSHPQGRHDASPDSLQP